MAEKDIAHENHNTEKRTKTHINSILRKLGVHTIKDALHAIPVMSKENEKESEAYRQEEILRYRSYELTNPEIAYILAIQHQTVNNLVKQIFMKSSELKSVHSRRSSA